MIKPPKPSLLNTSEAPTEPHLAVVVDNMGSLMALPPGAQFMLVENPNNPNKIFPMILEKVNLKGIHFICACGQKGCSRRMVYKLNMTGYHPPIQRT